MDEERLNSAEYTAQSVRQLTIAMAGKKSDKSYADYRFSDRYLLRKWRKESQKQEEIPEDSSEGVPWWADDEKYNEWIEKMGE